MFDDLSLAQLVALIRNAVRDHSLPASWLPSGTYTRDEAAAEVRDIMFEFGLAYSGGKLVQAEEDAA